MKKMIAVTMSKGVKNDVEHEYLDKWYIDLFCGLGYLPVLIPNTDSGLKILESMKFAGIVLSGGADISFNYPSVVKAMLKEPSPVRDKVEEDVLNFALTNKIPIFGICRGIHFLNVKFGGDLLSGLSQISEECYKDHYSALHEIRFLKDNAAIQVNSYHHQGFTERMISPEFEVLALSTKDGVVEAMAHKNLPILAVQWHPERPNGNNKWVSDSIKDLFK